MGRLDELFAEEADDSKRFETVDKIQNMHKKPIVGLYALVRADTTYLVTVGHDCAVTWQLVESKSRQEARLTEPSTFAQFDHCVQSTDMAKDGDQLVLVTLDSCVQSFVYSYDEGKYEKRAFEFEYMKAIHIALAPNRKVFLTVSILDHLYEIDASNNQPSRKVAYANSKIISCIKYASNMKYFAVGQNDGVIELFDQEAFRPIHKFEVHSMKIRKIEFLPGDERFLSACDDRTIKLNSVTDLESSETNRTSRPIRVFAAHNDPVIGLAIDGQSGGTRFASSTSSGQIFVWHIEIATPVFKIKNDHVGMLSAIVFSPNSRYLISGGEDAMICVFRIPSSGDHTPDHSDSEDVNIEEYERKLVF